MPRVEITIEDKLREDGCGSKLHARFGLPEPTDDDALAPPSLHAAADIQKLFQSGALAAQFRVERTPQHNLFLGCLLDFICECAEKPPEHWRELFDDLDAYAAGARDLERPALSVVAAYEA